MIILQKVFATFLLAVLCSNAAASGSGFIASRLKDAVQWWRGRLGLDSDEEPPRVQLEYSLRALGGVLERAQPNDEGPAADLEQLWAWQEAEMELDAADARNRDAFFVWTRDKDAMPSRALLAKTLDLLAADVAPRSPRAPACEKRDAHLVHLLLTCVAQIEPQGCDKTRQSHESARIARLVRYCAREHARQCVPKLAHTYAHSQEVARIAREHQLDEFINSLVPDDNNGGHESLDDETVHFVRRVDHLDVLQCGAQMLAHLRRLAQPYDARALQPLGPESAALSEMDDRREDRLLNLIDMHIDRPCEEFVRATQHTIPLLDADLHALPNLSDVFAAGATNHELIRVALRGRATFSFCERLLAHRDKLLETVRKQLLVVSE